ncbi:putative ATP-grasp-modified RiPP [Embleya sp. NBC_00896]|uniref:putative ATP-grasp-modified RiPP n=1 Tax=Embleya sp. NBC_00896 TaxID=2975961 RepID=UPI00386890EC
MLSYTTVMPAPFGMRHLTEAPTRPDHGVTLDPRLQIGVTREGNPWQGLADGDTQTETTPDGSGSGTDGDGTDVW